MNVFVKIITIWKKFWFLKIGWLFRIVLSIFNKTHLKSSRLQQHLQMILLTHCRPTFTMMALALHEANPGHHLQVKQSRYHMAINRIYADNRLIKLRYQEVGIVSTQIYSWWLHEVGTAETSVIQLVQCHLSGKWAGFFVVLLEWVTKI